MKTLEIIGNWFIVIVITIIVVVAFDWYKGNYVENQKNIIIVFSAKSIIENKKLHIKKAILNDGNFKEEEQKLNLIIQTIDLILKEISTKYDKPILQKEMVLYGNTQDITPLVEKALIEKGLL
ncbi:MAG: hypothetical protein WC141_09265 [Arcobacteraceae bacterium]